MPIDDRAAGAADATNRSTGQSPASAPSGIDGLDEHPDAEVLGAFAERKVDARTREAINRHLAGCPDCREWLALLTDTLHAEAPVPAFPTAPEPAVPPAPLPFRQRRRVIAVASGMVAAGVAFGLWIVRPEWLAGTEPDLGALVVSYRSAPYRAVNARLSGGFGHASAPQPLRRKGAVDGGSPPASVPVSADVRLAAADLLVSYRDDSTRSLWARGIAHLALQEYDEAVEALERAAMRATDAALQSDLSAAYLARASQNDDRAALAAAERALERAPRMPEALFNRALALEALGSPDAPAAWQAAIEADPDSAWAAEARLHLNERR